MVIIIKNNYMKLFLNFFDTIFVKIKQTNVGVGKGVVFVAWLLSAYLWINILLFSDVISHSIEKKYSMLIAVTLLFSFMIFFGIRYLSKKNIEKDILNFEISKEQKRRFNIILIILGLIPFILFIIFLSKYVFFRSYFVG